MIKRILISFFSTVFLLAGFGLIWLVTVLDQPFNNEENIVYEVKAGSSLRSNLQNFESMGLISQARIMAYYGQYRDLTNVKKGEYQIPSGLTLLEVINLLNKGQVVQYSVTLIEGKTLKDYRATLSSLDNIDHQLAKLSDQELLTKLGTNKNHVEGWFYPDTYYYQKGDSDFEILQRAHVKMQKVLDEQWALRDKNLPYKTPYEALIMASIIEKETGAAFERPEIAGVFVRRLQKPMRLQTDPTIIYGLGDRYKGNLTRAHLKEDGPYNTYTNSGLPPSPICNAAVEALSAALNPAKGDALYFVAKGDGTHYFSTNLRDHINAVNKYQRFKRSKNYQSSPDAK